VLGRCRAPAAEQDLQAHSKLPAPDTIPALRRIMNSVGMLRTGAHQLAVRVPAPGVRAARVAAGRRVREPRRDVQDPHAAQRGHERRRAHRRRGRAAVVSACQRRNLGAGVASVLPAAHTVVVLLAHAAQQRMSPNTKVHLDTHLAPSPRS